MKGLDYMNIGSSPTEVKVLYGKVGFEGDDNELLQQISEQLVQVFVDEGRIGNTLFFFQCKLI